MHFILIILTFLLTSTTTTANPTPLGHPPDPAGFFCKWSFCGKCNGGSCKISGINRGCGHNTSCWAQDGGGDGKSCGGETAFANSNWCPGRKGYQEDRKEPYVPQVKPPEEPKEEPKDEPKDEPKEEPKDETPEEPKKPHVEIDPENPCPGLQ